MCSIIFLPRRNDLDDVILTLIRMVPKGKEGHIKYLYLICGVVKHIIFKHNINFSYFYNKFIYLLIVFCMNSFI
jgi:hypothetical protein